MLQTLIGGGALQMSTRNQHLVYRINVYKTGLPENQYFGLWL